MNKRWSLILSVLCLIGSLVFAPRSYAVDYTLSSGLSLADQASQTLTFSCTSSSPTSVTLEVFARYDYSCWAGSNWLMNLAVNGVLVCDVKDNTNRGLGRLLNKDLLSRIYSNMLAPWYGVPPYENPGDPCSGWRLQYAPDFSNLGAFFQDNPYRTLVDITDLVVPGTTNSIVITNSAPVNFLPSTSSSNLIQVSSAVVHYNTAGTSSLMLLTPVAPTYAVNTGTPGNGVASYSVTTYSGGGFGVTVGTQTWNFKSAFSYPYAGFDLLSPTSSVDTNGETAWTVSKGSGSGNIVMTATASGSYFKVVRSVATGSHCITVTDTISNTTATTVGLIVRNEVSMQGKENYPVRLAGCPDTHVRAYKTPNSLTDTTTNGCLIDGGIINDYYSPFNPTVYIQSSDHGLGIVAQDKAYRNQAKLYIHPGFGGTPTAGIKTEMLRIPAGGSYTLTWSVYPVSGTDYFDFINLVRADWNSNIKTWGPWYWGFSATDIVTGTSSTELAVLANSTYGIRYAIQGGAWTDPSDLYYPYGSPSNPLKLGTGAGVFDDVWANFRGTLSQAVAAIHTGAPNCKAVLYYNEQHDTLSNSTSRFSDSYITGPSGAQDYINYSDPVHGVYFQLVYSLVPTTTNSFGSAMLSTATRYMAATTSSTLTSGLAGDGLYCDEMENLGYNSPLMTYNKSDGYSCLLDPYYFTITTDQIGLTQLLAEQHHINLINQVLSSSGVFLGNTPACTSGVLGTGTQRMVEAEWTDMQPSEAHLGTPLGYLLPGTSFGELQRLLDFGLLPVACGWSGWPVVGPAMATMFPLTPIELHMGYILGKERIITSHDGTYGWANDASLVLPHCFNCDGGGLDPSSCVNPTTYSSNQCQTQVAMGTLTAPPSQYTGGTAAAGQYRGALVILEKLPITVTGSGGGVVTSVTYSSSLVGFVLCPNSATWSVNVHNGKFPIAPNTSYWVTGMGTPRTMTSSSSLTDPVLSLNSVDGYAVIVTITHP